jgi:RHS repeat-associated protein
VSGGQSVTGNVYVAQEPEQFSYDADGNLTNDGRWAYTWDGENRLVGMTVNTNVGPPYQLTFAYDAKGRRIQKLVATNGVALSTNNFLYDGWNLVAETAPNNSLIRTYVWGTDLSGTSQGAGGVGGLLEISYYGSSTTNCFTAYDGNGNIMALVNAADGTVAANYDYAAFGEPIRITGVLARNNPFRFSTKYADDESDLLYYGYRYYKPSTGTWVNRDPIKELGFNVVSTKSKESEKVVPENIRQLLLRFEQRDPVSYMRLQSKLAEININHLRLLADTNDVLEISDGYDFVKNDPILLVDPLGLRSFGFGCALRTYICDIQCVNPPSQTVMVYTTSSPLAILDHSPCCFEAAQLYCGAGGGAWAYDLVYLIWCNCLDPGARM